MVDFNDLPPELAEQVIGYYVKRVGVHVAWRRRSVCNKYITPSIPSLTAQADYIHKHSLPTSPTRSSTTRLSRSIASSATTARSIVSSHSSSNVAPVSRTWYQGISHPTFRRSSTPRCASRVRPQRQNVTLAPSVSVSASYVTPLVRTTTPFGRTIHRTHGSQASRVTGRLSQSRLAKAIGPSSTSLSSQGYPSTQRHSCSTIYSPPPSQIAEMVHLRRCLLRPVPHLMVALEASRSERSTSIPRPR
jgi:hypothetical protein